MGAKSIGAALFLSWLVRQAASLGGEGASAPEKKENPLPFGFQDASNDLLVPKENAGGETVAVKAENGGQFGDKASEDDGKNSEISASEKEKMASGPQKTTPVGDLPKPQAENQSINQADPVPKTEVEVQPLEKVGTQPVLTQPVGPSQDPPKNPGQIPEPGSFTKSPDSVYINPEAKLSSPPPIGFLLSKNTPSSPIASDGQDKKKMPPPPPPPPPPMNLVNKLGGASTGPGSNSSTGPAIPKPPPFPSKLKKMNFAKKVPPSVEFEPILPTTEYVIPQTGEEEAKEVEGYTSSSSVQLTLTNELLICQRRKLFSSKKEEKYRNSEFESLQLDSLRREEMIELAGFAHIPRNGDSFFSAFETQVADPILRLKISQSPRVHVCNTTLLGMVGFTDVQEGPLPATAEQTRYCPKARYSCCSARHLQAAASEFTSRSKYFLAKFDVISELLVVLKDPRLQSFYVSMQTKERVRQCSYHVNVGKSDFYQTKVFSRYVETLQQIEHDTRYYTRQQLQFYSRLICTLCDPDSHGNFRNETGIAVIADTDVCRQFIQMTSYELRLARLFNSFLFKLIQLIRCYKGTLIDTEEAVTRVNPDVLRANLKAYQNCLAENSLISSSCAEVCRKSLRSYSMPYGIFLRLKKTLKIIFNLLTNHHIEDYYLLWKREKYWSGDNSTMSFFMQGGQVFDDVEVNWRFVENDGVNFFKTELGTEFLDNAVPALLATLALALLSLLFN